jgi:hypothetical protein
MTALKADRVDRVPTVPRDLKETEGLKDGTEP